MSGSWSEALPYFSKKELACKGSGVIRLDLRFAASLPALRLDWGRPLTLTSVCSSPEHNKSVGGHPRSLHLTENHVHPVQGTMAADIAWSEWSNLDRERFYRTALTLGWSVGLHPSFVHVDRRSDVGLPRVTFHYPTWNRAFPDRA
jgi:zinc D-Ala-D-Ala carboxypeptidase